MTGLVRERIHWINGSETSVGDVELCKRKAEDFRKSRDAKIEQTELIPGPHATIDNERETKTLSTENLISRASYAPDTKSNRIEKLENLHFEVKRIKSGSSKKRKQ